MPCSHQADSFINSSDISVTTPSQTLLFKILRYRRLGHKNKQDPCSHGGWIDNQIITQINVKSYQRATVENTMDAVPKKVNNRIALPSSNCPSG